MQRGVEAAVPASNLQFLTALIHADRPGKRSSVYRQSLQLFQSITGRVAFGFACFAPSLWPVQMLYSLTNASHFAHVFFHHHITNCLSSCSSLSCCVGWASWVCFSSLPMGRRTNQLSCLFQFLSVVMKEPGCRDAARTNRCRECN